MPSIFGFLWKIVCLLGCVYQSFKISELYFTYETTTNVKYEEESSVELPGITICYRLLSQVKTAFTKRIFNYNDTNHYNDYNIFGDNTTLQELTNYLDKSPLRLKTCQAKTDKNYTDCDQIKNITDDFDGQFYCFTLFRQDEEQDQIFSVKKSRNNLKTFVSIIMNKMNLGNENIRDQIFLTMHSRREIIKQVYGKGSFILYPDYSDYTLIDYQKTVVKYLFKQKTNPCFVGQTGEDCNHQCQIDEFIKITGKYPIRYLFNSYRNSKLTSSTRQEFIEFNGTDNCSKKCAKYTDCFKEHFICESSPSKLGASNWKDFGIFINFPTHPTTIYEISLKMSFEEYLCLIASIVSLWFGFSILMFTQFCQILFNKIINKYKIVINNSNNNNFILIGRPPRAFFSKHLKI